MSNTNGDYVLREAAIAAAIEGADDWDGGPNITRDTCICDAISALAPADVRPVVYCRDCIHRPYETVPGARYGLTVESPDSVYKCPCFNPDDGYYSRVPEDDFFCAYGERRGADMRPEPPKDHPAPICQTCGNFEVCAWHEEGIFGGPKDNARRVVACSDYKTE